VIHGVLTWSAISGTAALSFGAKRRYRPAAFTTIMLSWRDKSTASKPLIRPAAYQRMLFGCVLTLEQFNEIKSALLGRIC
jgi:hypothetical protein